MSGDEHTAVCGICQERVPCEEILAHLADVHDQDVEIQCWPDGSPVVVDLSLTPDDFLA